MQFLLKLFSITVTLLLFFRECHLWRHCFIEFQNSQNLKFLEAVATLV